MIHLHRKGTTIGTESGYIVARAEEGMDSLQRGRELCERMETS